MRAGTRLTGMRKFGLGLALVVGTLGFFLSHAIEPGLGVARAGALEVGKAQEVSGRVTVNKGTRVGPETEFKEGDVIDASGGAQFTLTFDDGCQLEVVGPARIEILQLADEGRRIKLVQGVVSEAFVLGIALELQTGHDASLVLQNATAAARVIPGERVFFERREGGYLAVFEGRESQDLTSTWEKSLRKAAAAPSAAPAAKSDRANFEVGKAQGVSGRVTVNKDTRVGSETEFEQGDVIDVSGGARFTLSFADGCQLDVVGPARLEVLQLADEGRRIKLVQGVISEVFVRGVALELQTDYEASLVMQNATASARVIPGERVVFQRREGGYLKVYEGPKSQDLKSTWQKSLRGAGAGASAKPAVKGDHAEFKLGERMITYSPASDFTKEDGPEGGVKLTYNGNDFGRVDVGMGTVLFLSNGQSVVFDGSGRVSRFDGISHLYHPINEWSWYEEPIENAADASIADPRER